MKRYVVLNIAILVLVVSQHVPMLWLCVSLSIGAGALLALLVKDPSAFAK